MTLDWKILEEEEEPFPAEGPSAHPPSQRWRWLGLLLLFCLLALALLAGTLFWQRKEQEAQIRRELTEVIEAEARAQGFGLVEQVGIFADTGAPPNWRLRYLHLFEPERRGETQDEALSIFYFGIDTSEASSALPVLQALRVEEAGQRASVKVAWRGESAVSEQRAYRFVDGSWRRTPLQAGLSCSWESGSRISYQLVDGEWQSAPCREDSRTPEWIEVSYPTFQLRGQRSDVLALSEPGDFYLGLGGLPARLAKRWPETVLLDRVITLTVETQEFSGPILAEQPGESSILINSPESTRLSRHVPLTGGAQYRLMVTNVLLFGLLDYRRLSTVVEEPRIAALLLVQAEARRWALSGEERRTLRNAWRAELAGGWSSPFDPQPTTYGSSEEDEAFVRYWLSWHLLLEWLLEQGYISSPGELANIMLIYPTISWEARLTHLTGLSRDELEAAARHYALTPEP